MAPLLLAAVIGAAIGLSLGTLGGGGSILTVPALIYLLGQNPHGAVGSSLVIVGMNALMGAWLHQRAGHVRLRAALLFGAAGIAAAFGGARLSRLLPGPALLVLFALLMIVIAVLMLRGKTPQRAAEHLAAPVWWRVLLGGGVPGLLLGARLARRLPTARLRQGFAVFVVMLGVTLLLINLPIALR